MKRKQPPSLPWPPWETFASVSFGAHARMEVPAPCGYAL